MEKCLVERLAGCDILVSNNITKREDGIFYPLSDIKDKTLAGGVSFDLKTKSYMPEKNFNEHINAKCAKYTKVNKSVKILYTKGFSEQPEAMCEEYRIKKLTRIQKLEMI